MSNPWDDESGDGEDDWGGGRESLESDDDLDDLEELVEDDEEWGDEEGE